MNLHKEAKLLKEQSIVNHNIKDSYKIYTDCGKVINIESSTCDMLLYNRENNINEFTIEDNCINTKVLAVIISGEYLVYNISVYMFDYDVHIDFSIDPHSLYAYRDLKSYEFHTRAKIQEIQYKPFRKSSSIGAQSC